MSSDNSMWAPPGDGDEPPARSPLGPDPSLPDAPSRWAPPADQPPAFTPPAPPVGSEPVEEDAGPPESVIVGPIEAANVSGSTRVARLVAAVLAIAMVSGGAFLAFGAGSASGGAESPEAAFEQALSALEAGDLIALAEVMDPAERDTVFDAGFAFLDELVRLEVLAEDFDASAVEGFDFSLTGAELTVERPRDDLARIYVGSGLLDASVDVAALPLGRRILDRLSPEQQTHTERDIEVLESSDTPFVAVQRDGRWYLSYWYTAAENIRLDAGAPLPDPLDRPAPIGAATPEAAAVRFLEEAVRFDLARMIGMLDPDEAAALYDYSPLFLDDAATAANQLLEAAEADGWTWGFDELEFRAETDGDLATVFLEGLTFSAAGAGGAGSFALADGEIAAELTVVDDFWGEETSWTLQTSDGCAEITFRGDDVDERMNSCDESVEMFGSSVAGLRDIGLVARKVDGRWYLSPVRTTLDAVIAAVEQLEADNLEAAFGQALLGPGMVLGGEVFGGDVVIGPDLSDSSDVAFFPRDMLVNADLLAADLEVEFSYDLDAEQAAWELGFFAPGLDAVETVRGAYATIDGGIGEVALVVVEVVDAGQAESVLTGFADGRDGVAQLASNTGLRLSFDDDYGDPVYVDFDGVYLTLVGVYGTDAETAFAVLEQQTAG